MSEQDFQDQHDAEIEADLHGDDVDPETVVNAPPGDLPDPDDVELEGVEEREREGVEEREREELEEPGEAAASYDEEE